MFSHFSNPARRENSSLWRNLKSEKKIHIWIPRERESNNGGIFSKSIFQSRNQMVESRESVGHGWICRLNGDWLKRKGVKRKMSELRMQAISCLNLMHFHFFFFRKQMWSRMNCFKHNTDNDSIWITISQIHWKCLWLSFFVPSSQCQSKKSEKAFYQFPSDRLTMFSRRKGKAQLEIKTFSLIHASHLTAGAA